MTWITWLLFASNVGTLWLVCIALRRVRDVADTLALTDNWIGFAEPCDGPECFDDAVRELIEERLSRDAEAAQPPEPAWQTWLLVLERRAKDHEHD